MGNSAGGIHCLTWLFHEDFSQQRRQLVAEPSTLRLVGVINQSGPLTFASPVPAHRSQMLRAYYGGIVEDEAPTFVGRAPLGLFKALVAANPNAKTPRELYVPPIVNLAAEWETDDEVLDLFPLFQIEWEKYFGDNAPNDMATKDFNHYSSNGLETLWMEGHNHISPPLALMAGEGEEWTGKLLDWMDRVL
ncbi:hypothetical protein NW762_006129 [Fusarium torreyae]|uniref:Uncharacterized protein n=1 Tax=Fusarium torreyae TaxID=1237075 RepID=A0A9W8S2B4_9HYPO|nr:hypothetical protein NW762_006129 [Fusarium torreyae]